MADPAIKLALSGPMKVDLEVYRGDSGRFRVTVVELGGTPVVITDATWDAEIRTKVNDPNPLTSFDIELVDPSTFDVVLPADKSVLLTGNCFYDVEMTLLGVVTTLISGSITVTQDVSRT